MHEICSSSQTNTGNPGNPRAGCPALRNRPDRIFGTIDALNLPVIPSFHFLLLFCFFPSIDPVRLLLLLQARPADPVFFFLFTRKYNPAIPGSGGPKKVGRDRARGPLRAGDPLTAGLSLWLGLHPGFLVNYATKNESSLSVCPCVCADDDFVLWRRSGIFCTK